MTLLHSTPHEIRRKLLWRRSATSVTGSARPRRARTRDLRLGAVLLVGALPEPDEERPLLVPELAGHAQDEALNRFGSDEEPTAHFASSSCEKASAGRSSTKRWPCANHPPRCCANCLYCVSAAARAAAFPASLAVGACAENQSRK